MSEYVPAGRAWAVLVLGSALYATVADVALWRAGKPLLSTAFRSAARGPVSGPLLAGAWFGGFAALTAHFYNAPRAERTPLLTV